jgi:hypothetical protein
MPSESTAIDWITRLHDLDESLEEEIGHSYYSLLCSIVCQYTKFKYAMFYRNDWENGDEAIVQNRLIFSFQNRTKSFTITDSFNNDSEMLQAAMDKSSWTDVCFPTMIADGRILINVVKRFFERPCLLLLDLGLDQLKCSVLHNVPLNFRCDRIVIDSKDNSWFVLLSHFEGLTIAYKGYVADDNIHVEAQRIEFGVRLFGCKLMGNRIFAFHHEHDDPTVWKFVEYDISSDLASKLNERSLSEFSKSLDLHSISKYIWVDKKMYAVCQIGWNFSIAVFNSSALTWSTTNFFGAGGVNTLSIDEDQILTVSASHYHSMGKTVYRFPTRTPDKLCYIAWGTIRRGSLFFGSDIYDKLILPNDSKFRSFFE